MSQPNLPSRELLCRQTEWLAPARSRLLRRAEIARRRSVLDLACGRGAVTEELVRRCGGQVVALDCSRDALSDEPLGFAGAAVVCGNAEQLPLADKTFDLVFCQFALVWLDVPVVLREIRRVLMRGGVLVAIEPDYGGLIEHPPEIGTRDLWLSAMRRAGGDPCVGRKLPELLAEAGFRVEVDLLDRLTPPSPLRFEFLGGLPLDDAEKASLDRAKQADGLLAETSRVAHLPVFLIRADVFGA